MQFVPAKGPRSGGWWRVLVVLFAGLLTLGVFQPMTASAGNPALLKVKDKVVVEGDAGTSTAMVKIVLNKRVGHKVSVGYATRDASAKAGTDYVATSGRVWFPKWTKKAFVPVGIIGDKTSEPDEFFKVKIFRAYGAVIYDRVGKVWIEDNDPAPPPEKPKLIARDLTVNEAVGTAYVEVVLLSKGPHLPVVFDFTTVDAKAKGGAACAGTVDYKSTSGRAVIGKYDDDVKIPVTICNDGFDEVDEDFLLRVSPLDLRIVEVLKAQSHVVILDNDAPPVLSIGDDTATEGSYAHLKVTLTPQSGKTVTVDYDTFGFAGSAGDFVAKSGTLTFTPGETEEFIHVFVKNDGTVPAEGIEKFIVRLSNEVNATVADGHRAGTVTIPANP